MVSQRKPAKFVGALAAIVAAIEGAILLTRKTVQAAPITVVSLAKEVMDLLAAMAQGIGSILEKLDEIVVALQSIAPGGGGYPENADGITATFVGCPFPQPQSFQLPSIVVPKGMELELLARNPAGVNVGIIWVSGTSVGAGGAVQARPLIPGATVSYKVKNANSLYIGATIANEGVYISVEQNKG